MNTKAKTDQLTRLSLRPGVWSDRFHEQAAGIPHDEPADLPHVLRDKVNRGAASVAEIVRGGKVLGFVVYSLAFSGREFVVIAVYGRDNRNLAGQLNEHLEAFARSLGCSSLRFHTMRPGLVRRAVAAGYHVGEIILRKHLSA